MTQETFFNYRRYRWLWVSLIVMTALSVLYVQDNPIGGRNGGTVIGYTYGGLAAFGIFYLMWYGMRKRSYYSRFTTLKGWLAAHVWIGISLLLLVPLHSGFSFGWNVHTLAYALMVLTIFSGIWGALNYATLAQEIRSHRGGGSTKKLLEQLALLDAEIDSMVADKSDQMMKLKNKINVQYVPSIIRSFTRRAPEMVERSVAAALMVELPDDEKEAGLRLVSSINQKREQCARMHDEIKVQAKMKLWLLFHVPLSFSCVAALVVHIFAVFYYW